MRPSARVPMTRRLLILLISLFVTCVYAQIGRDSLNRTGSVRVHVTLGAGRACDVQATVSLVSTFGPGVAQDFTNADCEVNFVNVAAGSYHLAVSGAGIESSDSGAFELASRGFMELSV